MDFYCDEVVLCGAAWFADGSLTDGSEELGGCVGDASEDLVEMVRICMFVFVIKYACLEGGE